MLPANYYISPFYMQPEWQSDALFITEQLRLVPNNLKRSVCEKYNEIYLELMRDDPDNTRKRVNTWLRKTAKKLQKTYDDEYF